MTPYSSHQSLGLNSPDKVQLGQPNLEDASAGRQEQSPISCHLCHRSYTRADHLARHLRSHTKEKPFTCDVCEKGFSRIDVLKRHLENHDSTKPNKRLRASTQPTQNRVSRACRACAEGKLKCSESHPCQRCMSKGLVCEYGTSPIKSSTRPQSSNPAGSSNVVDGLSTPSFESMFATPTRDTFNGSADSQHQESHATNRAAAVMTRERVNLGSLSPTQKSHVNITQGLVSPTFVSNADSNLSPFTPHDIDQWISRNFHDYMMVDFMSNIMNDGPPDSQHSHRNDAPLPDILDFAFDGTFDFQPTELVQPPYLTGDVSIAPNAIASGTATPPIQRLVSLGQRAFNESMWLWIPSHEDSATAEQANLSLSTPELVSGESADAVYHLSQATRDRILSAVLRTCEPIVQRQVVTCFPSADMLASLVTAFVGRHSRQFAPWIHIPSLDINNEREEFILALIASGAAASPHPNVRNLGFAMQEAVRNRQNELFDADNRNVRDLRLSQMYILQLQIGLWSGNRRKMEISEGFMLPLITMLRRGGKFWGKPLDNLMPLNEDNSQTIELKWQRWIEYESFKRLAYHIFLTDTGMSFSLMNQPLISYAEIHLDLPCSQELWRAPNAPEWKYVYLSRSSSRSEEIPNLRSALEDVSVMTRFQEHIDVQMSLAVIASTIWSRVWQCLQMKTLQSYQTNTTGSSGMLTVNTYSQELVHAAKNVSLRSSDWIGGLGPHAELLLELCMLHLHVSLEVVQLFAGKNGEEEARKVVPVLRRWIKSSESRQAVYHAGRILQAARHFPFGHLRDHSAVAVYHAGLALWAYAVLSDPSLHLTEAGSGKDRNRVSTPRNTSRVILDNPEGSEMQHFLVLGNGDPAIRKYDEFALVSKEDDGFVSLSNTLIAMESIAGLLASKNGHEQQRPPIIGNLNKLILALGKAAVEMKRKGK